MARYVDIECDTVRELIGRVAFKSRDDIQRFLDNIPTADVVEVVRCKNCKFFGKDLGYGKHDCKKYELPYCLENDFCSYGERNEKK